MAWKTMDIHEQRVRFVVEATQRVKPFSALCTEYDISRPTGYLWLRRCPTNFGRWISRVRKTCHNR
jgi:hypothetical protein